MRKNKTIVMSSETEERLKELKKHFGTTGSEVIAIALLCLAKQEGFLRRTQKVERSDLYI